jgi:hypothetical protein
VPSLYTLIHFIDNSTGYGYSVTFEEQVNGDLSLLFNVETSAWGRETIVQNIPVKIGEWQSFVFLITRSSTDANVYIDAVAMADTIDGSTTPTGNPEVGQDFYLGYDPLNPSSSNSGIIDIDGFVYYGNIAFSQPDISNIYNRGRGYKSDDTDNPLLSEIDFAFDFDEGSGNTVEDVVSSNTFAINSYASSIDDVWSDTGGVAVLLPDDLKLYLTSLEPDLEQMNYAQSIGGYTSETLLYPETKLGAALGLYSTAITLDDATDLIGYTDVAIKSEIISVESISGTSVTATERGLNGVVGFYPLNTIVQGVSNPFNDAFNSDRNQYRCYTLKNTSDTEVASGVGAYFRHLSENTETIMRLALERPKSQGITGVSTSWTSSMLIDSSIAGTYADNLFAESYMTFVDAPNAGERRRIASYDGATGTFVFADSLPVDYEATYSSLINYTVDASPAQRVKSGVDEPADNGYISNFSTATDRNNSVLLSGLNTTGVLSPGDIMYVWVERKVGKSNSSYDDNSFVLSIYFEKEFTGA